MPHQPFSAWTRFVTGLAATAAGLLLLLERTLAGPALDLGLALGLCLALLLAPRPEGFWQSAAAAVSASLALALVSRGPVAPGFLAGHALLCWCLLNLGELLVGAQRRPAIPALVCALAVLVSLPLWLGPLADALAPAPAFNSLLVGLSPLSFLAALLDYDYLRSAWFYQHSALGGLRYAYPHPWIWIAALVVTGGLSRWRIAASRRNPSRPQPGPGASDPQQ